MQLISFKLVNVLSENYLWKNIFYLYEHHFVSFVCRKEKENNKKKR